MTRRAAPRVLAVLMCAVLAACGGARGSRSEAPATAADIAAWLATEPTGPADRLLRSHWHELLGAEDVAAALILGDDAWPAEWEDARAFRAARLHDTPSFPPRFGRPIEDDPSPVAAAVWSLLHAAQSARADRLRMQPTLLWDAVPVVPSQWRVAGPVSSYPSLDFETEHPLHHAAELPAEVVLGSGPQAVLRAATGPSGLVAPGVGRGVTLAETWLVARRDVTVSIVASSVSPYRLWLGTTEIARRTPSDAFAAATQVVHVHLGAGAHRVWAQLAYLHSPTPFWVSVVSDEAEPAVATFVTARPNGAVEGTVTRGAELDLIGAAMARARRSELDWLGATDAAIELGDPIAARALLDVPPAPASPVVALAIARLQSVHFTVAPDLRDSTREAALRVSAAFPGAVLPRAMLLSLLTERAQWDDAAEWARVLEAEPLGRAGAAALAEYFDARGWTEIALPWAERAEVAGGGACADVERLLRLRTRMGLPLEQAGVPPAWLGCDAVQRSLARLHDLPRGACDAAGERARVQVARAPADVDALTLADETAEACEGPAAQAEIWRAAQAWRRDRSLRAAVEADGWLAAGRPDEAQTALEGVHPGRPPDAHVALAGAVAGLDDRVQALVPDGAALVSEYLSGPARFDSDVVYVLDFGRTDVFDDGSAQEVVYQLVELRTRDALTSFGELGIPGDATLLRARTIKRDGRLHVPEDIAAKDSISFPAIEQGDFVEYAWVRQTYGPLDESSAFRSDRFYFQTGDGAMARSEVVYTLPAAAEARFDVRGDGVGHAADVAGDRVEHRFWVDDLPTFEHEGHSVSEDELVPSVRMSVGLEVDALVRMYQDALTSLVAPSPQVVERAAELMGGRGSDRDRVQALFRFVVDDVFDGGGFFSTPAAWTASRGTGERLPLLVSLLHAAGYDPEVLFARTRTSDQSESDVPDLSPFDLTLVRVPLPNGEVWLEADLDGFPFDYLRPEAVDVPAVVVFGPRSGARVRTPARSVDVERAHTRIAVALRADGSADVEIEEELPMRIAAASLTSLQTVDDEEALVRDAARSLAESFPGVSDLAVDFSGLSSPDAAGQIGYRFVSGGFAVVEGDRLVIDRAILPLPIATWYADRPTRTQPLLPWSVLMDTTEVWITAPPGFSVAAAPASAESGRPDLLAWSRVVRAANGAVSIARSVELPMTVISPDVYSGFAREAVAFEAGDAVRVVFERVR